MRMCSNKTAFLSIGIWVAPLCVCAFMGSLMGLRVAQAAEPASNPVEPVAANCFKILQSAYAQGTQESLGEALGRVNDKYLSEQDLAQWRALSAKRYKDFRAHALHNLRDKEKKQHLLILTKEHLEKTLASIKNSKSEALGRLEQLDTEYGTEHLNRFQREEASVQEELMKLKDQMRKKSFLLRPFWRAKTWPTKRALRSRLHKIHVSVFSKGESTSSATWSAFVKIGSEVEQWKKLSQDSELYEQVLKTQLAFLEDQIREIEMILQHKRLYQEGFEQEELQDGQDHTETEGNIYDYMFLADKEYAAGEQVVLMLLQYSSFQESSGEDGRRLLDDLFLEAALRGENLDDLKDNINALRQKWMRADIRSNTINQERVRALEKQVLDLIASRDQVQAQHEQAEKDFAKRLHKLKKNRFRKSFLLGTTAFVVFEIGYHTFLWYFT